MATKTGVTPIAQEAQSLVDRVGHAIRQAILSGRLRPGETVAISDLAADFGVSQSPVREALQRLSSQGIVLLRPSRTAVVAPLDTEDLREIYRLRRLNEVDAAFRACPHLTLDDEAILERDLHVLAQASRDSDDFWESHDSFHRTLVRPVATPRLERLIADLWQAAERYIRVVYMETDALTRHSAYERHLPLLEAARSRSGSTMRSALLEHIDVNEREISERIEEIVAARGLRPQAGAPAASPPSR
jgi:DNA-binding GntR family transcriptional regulator